MGGAAVVWVVTGLSPKLCVVLAGFAKAAISIPGGLKAVVYTDGLQTASLFCGFGFKRYSSLGEMGGLSGLRQEVPPKYFSFLGIESRGLWNVLSLIVVLTLNPIADPGRRLTIYSAHSERTAKWSMVASGIAVILFSIVIGITGMYTFHLNPNLPSADQALPWLVMNKLPPWLAGFVVVAVVSGMSSAANGNAAAAGTFFVRHIYPLMTKRYPERPVVVARWALVFGFLASTILALYLKNIVDFVKTFLPLTMSGLGVIVILGRFWKRSTWQGALAAVIITPAVTLFLMFGPVDARLTNNPVIPATLVGALSHVLVSLMTRPPQRTFDEIAEALTIERKAIEKETVPALVGHEYTIKPTLA
jgi:SSS family solute:Na+ symporter